MIHYQKSNRTEISSEEAKRINIMQLPTKATGFFDEGIFHEPIHQGEFLQMGLSTGPRESVHRGGNRHLIMREKLLCRTIRWNRDPVHERIYRLPGASGELILEYHSSRR